MRKYAATLFLALCGMTAMAQSKFNVSGTVIEDETKEAVVSATVRVLSLPDSAMVDGAATDATGRFTVKNVKKGKYAIKVTFVGYRDKVVPLDLNTAKSKDVNVGNIALATNAKLLKEAQVSATAAKVQVSGDSLVYNSSAYRVPEGSALQELVKQLPGAKVDDEGNITINGKSVKKILMGGKEFFSNDTKVAMQNIPTDIIDKIKSYDRKSDFSRVTGIDDGEEETVLDLTVKKGMDKGWIGNLNLGAGTEHRYTSRLYAQRMLEDGHYTLLGGMNNNGDRGFGGGGGRGWGFGGSGLRASKNVGLNFANGNDVIELGGNLRFRYDGSDSQTESNTQNFVTPTGAFTNSISKSLGSNMNVNTEFRMEWTPDSMTNIIFRPQASYGRNRGYSNSVNATFNNNPDDYSSIYEGTLFESIDRLANEIDSLVVNSNNSRQQTYSDSRSLSGNLQVNRKLNNEGRNITLRVNGNISGSDSKQLSASDIRYYLANRPADTNNRYYSTPGRNRGYSVQATYSEPIAYKTYLQFSYRFNYSYSKNDRQAFTYDPTAYTDLNNALNRFRYDVGGIVDYLLSNGIAMRADSVANRLSQYSVYNNYNHTASISFRKVGDTYNLSAGIDFMPQHSVLDYKYMGINYPTVSRTVYNWAPSIDYRYNPDKQTQLRINYRSRTQQPSMTNLLDIEDDSNPLNITRGNTQLKPSLSHNFGFNYNTYNVDRQEGIFSWGNMSFTQNSISNRVSYDAETGVRTTKPENINGNWNTNLGFGYNTGIGKEKYFTLNSMTNLGYNHQVSYLDPKQYTEDKSHTNDLTVMQNLSFAFRKDWFQAGINGNMNYRHSKNSVLTTGNLDTWTFSYGADMNLFFENGFSLSTDISQDCRRGYSTASMNTNELIWNAQVSKSFLKGNALTVTAQWNDILQNRSNISRNITAMMSSDSKSNSIYSYGMITLIYKLNVFGGGGFGNWGGGFGGFGGGMAPPPGGGGRQGGGGRRGGGGGRPMMF